LIGLAKQYPAIYVNGPRQSGKTTLCRTAFPDKAYVNLEDPALRSRVLADPVRFLDEYPSGAILDEIQRTPQLASYLQVRIDQDPTPGRFILTGSQSFEVFDSLSQSLAGRAAILRLLPLSLEEVRSPLDADYWMYHGFYPRIHAMKLSPEQMLGDYVSLYVERDVRQFALIHDLDAFRRFLRLTAGRVGQLLNISSLANDVGVSRTSISTWISILRESFIAFLVEPYHANIGKRITKSPKMYFYDVGLACYLLGITNVAQLATHPLRGSLFENMVVSEVCKYFLNRARRPAMHFYRDSTGSEIDLIVDIGATRMAIEIKSAKTFASEWIASFDRVPPLVIRPDSRKILVYAGESHAVKDVQFTNPFDLATHFSATITP
jgi:uncharacterized protein